MLMDDMGHSPAHPAGPIPDGTQLTDITSSPGNVVGRSVNTTPTVLVKRAAPPADASPAPAASPAASTNVEKRE
jgi:hypothetical protein